MISEENLVKLYDGVLEEKELTTKQLKAYGFNSKDLSNLIEDGRIIRLRRGLYSLDGVDELFHYGKQLLASKNYRKADLCFERCFLLDQTHLGVCFQLFIRSIQNEDYQKAFELYDSLYQTDNEYYQIDFNFYLYLLSIITEVPEKHREYARYIHIDDIKVPRTDKRFEDIPLQNKMRIAVLQRKFSFALKQLTDLISIHGRMTFQDLVIKTLIKQALIVENNSKRIVLNLIKEKKYDEVINHLLNKQLRHNLSIFEESVLKLAYKILEIRKSSIVPEVKMTHADNLFAAIDAEDYITALRISTEYNNKNNFPNDSNAINLLLSDICFLIRSLKTISTIIVYLRQNELDTVFIYLSNYLKSIGKINYEFLVADLIKISLLEKDMSFEIVKNVLIEITNGTYSFEIASFIQTFYTVLVQNKFDEARVYLDIVSKADKIGQECVIMPSLYRILELSEKELMLKSEVLDSGNIDCNQTDDIVANELTSLSLGTESETQSKGLPILKIEQSFTERESYEIDSEKEFLDEQYNELISKKGIILLKSMSSSRVNRIFEMLKDYPDMAVTVMGDEKNQQVVLRYSPFESRYLNVKDLIILGNKAYNLGDYDLCINYFSQLLQFLDEPQANIYAKLGLAYMKKEINDLAIDYLTVATELSKKGKFDYDFSDMILKLCENLPQRDLKSRFKMSQENFNEINDYILETGMDVQTACEQMGMSQESIDIVKLIYAREFYIQENFEKGDLFLVSVERSKSKTKAVIKLLEEIRKNKRFYKNRKVENSVTLMLTFRP